MTLVYNGLCQNDYFPNEKTFSNTSDARSIRYLMFYGTGSKLLFLQIIDDIPRYVFLSYISIKLPVLLVKRIRHRDRTDRHLSREQKILLYSSLPHSVESRYVRNLLGMSTDIKPKSALAKATRSIYAWRDDFRFSSRVVCVFAAVFLLLFFITMQVGSTEMLNDRSSLCIGLDSGSYKAKGVSGICTNGGQSSGASLRHDRPNLRDQLRSVG